MGLRGRVRNTDGGAVELIAAGTGAQLAALRAALERGSRGSRVDRVEQWDEPASEAATLRAFTIEGAW